MLSAVFCYNRSFIYFIIIISLYLVSLKALSLNIVFAYVWVPKLHISDINSSI